MSVNAYKRAISLLRENGLEPLSIKKPEVSDIDLLEQRLNVRLPNSYREMLLDWGLLQVESIDIAGIGLDGLEGKTSSSVVFATEKDRQENLINDTMVRFAVTGYGPFFVIDCSQLDSHGEAPIYELPGNGYQNGKDRIASSFGDYLLEEATELVKSLFEEDAIGTGSTETLSDVKENYWKSRAKDFKS